MMYAEAELSGASLLTGDSKMEIRVIVAELKKERDRLDRAIAALDGNELKTNGTAAHARRAMGQRRTGSRLSAAGRKRLSELMKKRWAERRKKGSS
jgi:hypothetical protein